MARDYTKYSIEGLGENMNKRQLVFTIVKDWAMKNKPSLEEIQTAFPTETQGSKGFVIKASEVKDAKRFNMEEPLSIKNGTKVVVSNQWGTKNIATFLELAKKLGYHVTPVGTKSNVTEDITPGSHLTAKQIAKFREQEAKINGDYSENSWKATILYDDLIEVKDTAWADHILQKMVDAASDFSDLVTVYEKLKERNETERFLAVVKKAEDKAESVRNYTSLADEVKELDKDWVIRLYQKAEDKAESVRDYTSLADEVKELDKDWVIRLYQKAETVAADYDDITSLATEVKELDKDWSIKLYQKAETKAESSFDLRDLGETVYSNDKDWAASLMQKLKKKRKNSMTLSI